MQGSAACCRAHHRHQPLLGPLPKKGYDLQKWGWPSLSAAPRGATTLSSSTVDARGLYTAVTWQLSALLSTPAAVVAAPRRATASSPLAVLLAAPRRATTLQERLHVEVTWRLEPLGPVSLRSPIRLGGGAGECLLAGEWGWRSLVIHRLTTL